MGLLGVLAAPRGLISPFLQCCLPSSAEVLHERDSPGGCFSLSHRGALARCPLALITLLRPRESGGHGEIDVPLDRRASSQRESLLGW